MLMALEKMMVDLKFGALASIPHGSTNLLVFYIGYVQDKQKHFM